MSKKHRRREKVGSTGSSAVALVDGSVPAGDSVDKARMATSLMGSEISPMKNEPARRGVTVYNAFELMAASGYTKDGQRQTVQYQFPVFVLTVSERIDIVRLCSPVFGVVTNRMNRISGLEWKVSKLSKDEDRIAEELKNLKTLHDEYLGVPGSRAIGIRLKCKQEIYKRLPDVRRDLENFNASLLRWSKSIKVGYEDRCTEIEEWLRHPNQEDTFEDLTKKIVFDMMAHGAASPYKEYLDKRLENIYILPGGTIYPVKGRFVGQATGFIQLVDNNEPQVMFGDELSFLRYAPRSDSSYGSVPLEALVNKVAESLMFDQRSAEQADGTRPPEKLVVFGDRSPFGSIGEDFEMPVSKAEQRRIETAFNEPRKEAIRTLTGYGTPVVVDISRADTFAAQSERQKMVREEVGLVFGASPQEMNLTGSESTSGRNTSEAQERADLYKGVFPIVQALESFWSQQVFPFRYGSGYQFSYSPSTSEEGKTALLRSKKDSGLWSVNEIRTKEMGEDPFPGDEFNKPSGSTAQPGNNAQNPLFMAGL